MPTARGLRVIACLESVKGVLALLLGFGLRILSPEGRAAKSLFRTFSWLDPVRLEWAPLLALTYAAMRLSEGYGLW